MAKRAPVRKPFVVITAALSVGCGAKFDMGAETAKTDSGIVDSSPVVDARVDTLPSGCPSVEPTAGSACSPEGLSCDFGRCYAPYWMPGNFYSCEKGAWVAGASTCNPPPPPPPCPPDEPTVGAPCGPYYASKCQYRDECPESPIDYGYNDYACEGGTWRMTSPAYTVSCPGAAPKNGSACLCAPHMASTTCNFGDCYGTPDMTATCIARAWSVSYLSCNPPPPIDAGSGS